MGLKGWKSQTYGKRRGGDRCVFSFLSGVCSSGALGEITRAT